MGSMDFDGMMLGCGWVRYCVLRFTLTVVKPVPELLALVVPPPPPPVVPPLVPVFEAVAEIIGVPKTPELVTIVLAETPESKLKLFWLFNCKPMPLPAAIGLE